MHVHMGVFWTCLGPARRYTGGESLDRALGGGGGGLHFRREEGDAEGGGGSLVYGFSRWALDGLLLRRGRWHGEIKILVQERGPVMMEG
jgi:hypothetical protein